MARDNEVKRTESNEGGVHTVREERTTTVKAPSSSRGEFTMPSKSNMSYLIPVALAILLALALLSFRSGGLMGQKVVKPRTWQDTVSDSVSGLQDKLNEYTGLGGASDTTTKSAKAKAAELTAKAAAAAAKAKAEGKTYTDGAADSLKAKLSDTIDNIKDSVGIHDTDEAYDKAGAAAAAAKVKANEAKAKAGESAAAAAARAKASASDAAAKAKAAASDAATDAHKRTKDYVKDQRSYTTQASDYIHDKIDEVVDGVKSKVGLASEAVRHKKEELTEDARHAANVAAENAKHAAAEPQYSYGGDAKSKLNDAKRNLKQKAAEFVEERL